MSNAEMPGIFARSVTQRKHAGELVGNQQNPLAES
jgi:hypothetical protein